VPDDQPELPEDLVQLQRDYETAHASTTTYVANLEAEYAERYPFPRRKKTVMVEKKDGSGEEPVEVDGDPVWDEDQALLRNAWTDDENTQLRRLRGERETARKALWAHPAVTSAMAGGTWKQLHGQLKHEAGAPGWGSA